jgi:hypothetical protein
MRLTVTVSPRVGSTPDAAVTAAWTSLATAGGTDASSTTATFCFSMVPGANSVSRTVLSTPKSLSSERRS